MDSIIGMPRPLFVSIDGNVGSGKSTFVEEFRKRVSGNPNYLFVQEPVLEWESIKSKEGKSMIELFYANQSKYAFSFQMMAYISRLAILKEALRSAEKNGVKYIVSERSVDTDRHVFAKMLYDDAKIEHVEYEIYNKWYECFLEDVHIDRRVYLKATPQLCHQRVTNRARKGEDIPVSYLERCHDYHTNWLTDFEENKQILTLDGTVNIFDQPETLDSWIERVAHFLGDDDLNKSIEN